MLVKNALKEGTFSLRQLAEDEGISYGVLRAWASGRRTPEDENLRRLADGLKARAAKIQNLAEQLERKADE